MRGEVRSGERGEDREEFNEEGDDEDEEFLIAAANKAGL